MVTLVNRREKETEMSLVTIVCWCLLSGPRRSPFHAVCYEQWLDGRYGGLDIWSVNKKRDEELLLVALRRPVSHTGARSAETGRRGTVSRDVDPLRSCRGGGVGTKQKMADTASSYRVQQKQENQAIW